MSKRLITMGGNGRADGLELLGLPRNAWLPGSLDKKELRDLVLEGCPFCGGKLFSINPREWQCQGCAFTMEWLSLGV